MKNRIVILIILLIMATLAECAEPNLTIEIVPLTKEISVGQPFVFQLVCKLDQPLVSSTTNQISEIYNNFTPFLDIDHEKSTFSVERYKLFPEVLHLRQGKETEYYQDYSLFYCYVAEDKVRLMFPVPGKYTIKVRDQTRSSSPFFLDVKPASKLEEKALSILIGGTDLVILESLETDALKDYPEIMERFKKVVEQCGDTMIAKMAAARLGLEYFQQFHKKHPSFVNFKAEYQTGTIKEPLFEQSLKYLRIGAELPDEIPIRQVTLLNLSCVEFMKSNLKQAFSLINEIAEKYPNSEYGKQAISAQKEEIPKLKERYPEWSVEEPTQPESINLLGFALPATAIGAVVILVAGGILLYKKKAKLRK
jgi:hypothetical protein